LGVDLGSHSLRHTFASQLLDAGESVVTVAAMCGNTPQVIMNVYGHLIGDPRERVRAAVDAAWAQPAEGGAGEARR
jgi:site-specific recombinase XerD